MKFTNLLSKLISSEHKILFDEGYDHIKRLFSMALSSDSAVHILLVGPAAPEDFNAYMNESMGLIVDPSR